VILGLKVEMRRPWKLAIVMPTFFEQIIGGSEYQTYLLTDAAKKQGCDVHYIFISNDVKYNNYVNAILHTIPPIQFTKRFGAFWWIYSSSIRRELEAIKPDVVYVRGGWSFAGIGAAYAKRHGCRSIWHIASSADVTPRSIVSLLKRPLDYIERKAIKYAIRYSTCIVAHARFQADLLMKHYHRRAVVILKEQPEPTEELNKSDPFTIVWVANIKPLKQPEMFIRLAAQFVGNRNVRFIMIGRPLLGAYQDKLDTKIRELPNMTYMREQPIEVVNRILAQSHVFVNTSTYEGLPNTFVQSWMREVPVVSMLLDPDDILTTQKIGFFSGSFDQMLRDVKTLIEHPELCTQMGQRAREYALENHSLKKNMGRLLDLIFAKDVSEEPVGLES
jgi:glycosyltransferase involved in cell wall biosynthesis